MAIVRRTMRKLLLLFSFSFLLGACSNPFSGRVASIIKENERPKNTQCTDVRLDQSQVNSTQFKGIIHCLNQNKELEALDVWANQLTDEELSPWLNQFNDLIKNEPVFIYGIYKIYLKQKNSGQLQTLISQIFSKIKKQNSSIELISLIKKHQFWFTNFINSQNYKINYSKLLLLTEVKSFRRTINELNSSKKIEGLLKALVHYRQAPDAFSFQEIFNLFNKTQLNVIKDEESATKIAAYLDWLAKDQHLSILSDAAKAMIEKPITCFDGEKKIENPLSTLLTQLSTIDPTKADVFFSKQVPAVLLLGQGFCNIPHEVTTAAKLLQTSSQDENFSDFFKLIQPLLTEHNFVLLLTSKALLSFANQIQNLNEGHLFQDFVSVINWLNHNPIIEKNSAGFIDSIFNEFDEKDLIFIINHIPDDLQSYQIINEIYSSFSGLSLDLKSQKNINLGLVTKNSTAAVIDLFSKLNDDAKIFPIIDRVSELFKTMIDRGKNNYHDPILKSASHSYECKSQNWLLPLSTNSVVNKNPTQCLNLSLDFNMFSISTQFSSKDFLAELNKFNSCYESNQSFQSAEALLVYQLTKDPNGNQLLRFNRTIRKIAGIMFTLNSEQSFSMFNELVKGEKNSAEKLKAIISDSSNFVLNSKIELTSAIELRKLIAKYTSKQETYSAILSQLRQGPMPSLTIKSKNELTSSIISDIKKQMNEFCPDLDIHSSNCDVDSDQVIDFLVSPEVLAKKIINEYFTSKQSWAHPLTFSGWKTNLKQPINVSDVGYHLNPLLKQLDGNNKVVSSLFNFFDRNDQSNTDLDNFIKIKSHTMRLIPYVFQDPTFPQNNGGQYYRRIRLRIVSDLDRLELLAINADFNAFGFVKNFGLNFIREIATAWGDAPIDKRPNLSTNETLTEARTSIYSKMNNFNHSFLQKTGSCDPRGKNKFRQWLQNKFCSSELSDTRARIFNLKYMISIIDNDQDLILMRNLFYSFFENNESSSFGVFSNGVQEYQDCLSPQRTTGSECKRDLLAMIPRICRLGILHQASISSWLEETTINSSIINLLKNIKKSQYNNTFSDFFSSSEGLTFTQELSLFLTNSNSVEQTALARLFPEILKVNDQQWVLFLIDIIKLNPHLINRFSTFFHQTLLNVTPHELSAEMANSLTSVSTDLKNTNIALETAKIINKMPTRFSNLDFELSPWLEKLSTPNFQKQRDQISSFFTTDDFDLFCDVFSDATFVDKTYIFLDKTHQNSGALDLLGQCQRFFH